jgi:hypothetical protein
MVVNKVWSTSELITVCPGRPACLYTHRYASHFVMLTSSRASRLAGYGDHPGVIPVGFVVPIQELRVTSTDGMALQIPTTGLP